MELKRYKSNPIAVRNVNGDMMRFSYDFWTSGELMERSLVVPSSDLVSICFI